MAFDLLESQLPRNIIRLGQILVISNSSMSGAAT